MSLMCLCYSNSHIESYDFFCRAISVDLKYIQPIVNVWYILQCKLQKEVGNFKSAIFKRKLSHFVHLALMAFTGHRDCDCRVVSGGV